MSGPSVILFDLDETLYDHRHASRMALAHLQSRHPRLRAVSLDELDHLAFRILNQVHDAVLAGQMTTQDARIQRMRGLFASVGRRATEAFLDRAATDYGGAYRESERATPGASGLLAALRGSGSVSSIGIVTNHFAPAQQRKLRVIGLADQIDFMITSEDVGRVKPAPEPFEAALRQAGAGPGAAVMVGDSWSRDVVGALSAGIRPVWFNPRGESPGTGSVGGGPPPPVSELRSFEPVGVASRVILSG